MHYYEVAPRIIVRADQSTFTYGSDAPLQIGSIVAIEVGRRQTSGVVMQSVKEPSYATKPIIATLEDDPLPRPLIKTALWMSEYYATPLATVLQTMLPAGMTKKRRKTTIPTSVISRDRTNFVLNDSQQSAVAKITSTAGTVLLHGVTGSGKTAVYIEAAKHMLDSGKSVIVLVPEIALTSQLVAEFTAHFPSVTLTHSQQTEAQRHAAWRETLSSTAPHVVIGPRSALFMPAKDLGLIIIDEAHEPSFKQEQSPRYSALRTASVLARHHAAALVLGSATPSITDYYTAVHTKTPIVDMPMPAKTTAKPEISMIDMTKRQNFLRHRFLSDSLLAAIEQTTASGKQVLVFHNRRGSATTTLCENCGWQAGCPRCFVPLTLHADRHELRCHICGTSSRVPTSCPECGHADIIHKGIGTKLIESELRHLFPKLAIARFDGDSNPESSLSSQYQAIYDGSIDIIIGTQVVAKGLDLPHLRTVGIVQADAGLSLPDFTATERTFQLLAQVVGRVGRSEHATNIIVQSYHSTHPAVVDGIAQNYSDFYTRALQERRRAHFPPFTHLLKFVCSYKTEAAAIRNAKSLHDTIKQHGTADLEILGPTPAFYERQGGGYRWQLVVRSPSRSHLVSLIQYLPASHWQYELDPTSLLS